MTSSTPLTLHITSSTPIGTLDTAKLIQADASTDLRSAIDQCLEVFNTLNVLVVRRGVALPQTPVTSATLDTSDESDELTEEEVVDSLAAIDDGGDEEEEEGDGLAEKIESIADLPTNFQTDSASEEAKIAIVSDATTMSATNYVPSYDELTYQLNNLIFLGYVSAVESYFRCLTRQLVGADDFIAENVADQKITYGAAKHSSKELLPEAFLEEMTFISKDAVEKLLNQIFKVSPQNLAEPLSEYNNICQLRHCIVHRFGKLGTNNAIKLGLRTHATLFGKPIRLSSSDLSAIAFTLVNLVKAINNHVYVHVLQRTAKDDPTWHWNFEHDRPRFEKLYSVFCTTIDPSPSPSCEDAYNAFVASCKAESASERARFRSNRASV